MHEGYCNLNIGGCSTSCIRIDVIIGETDDDPAPDIITIEDAHDVCDAAAALLDLAATTRTETALIMSANAALGDRKEETTSAMTSLITCV